jgi:hypothetical protein
MKLPYKSTIWLVLCHVDDGKLAAHTWLESAQSRLWNLRSLLMFVLKFSMPLQQRQSISVNFSGLLCSLKVNSYTNALFNAIFSDWMIVLWSTTNLQYAIDVVQLSGWRDPGDSDIGVPPYQSSVFAGTNQSIFLLIYFREWEQEDGNGWRWELPSRWNQYSASW